MADSVEVSGGGTLLRDDGTAITEAMRFPGGIKTGVNPTQVVFGGFEAEDEAFGGALLSISTGTPTLIVTNGFPRWSLPDAATSGVLTPPFNCPVWYRSIDIHAGVTNEHTATGNVRVRVILREVDIGQAMSAAGSIADTTVTLASPGANGGVGLYQPVATVSFTPGAFGSIYTCEFQRIGGDGADTLAGALGVLSLGFTRTG